MPIDPKTPDADPPDPQPASIRAKAAAGRDRPHPGLQPSNPLQIFLLAALVITGAAYVVDEWTQMTTEEALAKRPSKVRRLLAAQNQFLTETELGRHSEAKKKY